ncbi:S-adenosyl-L-methionine-dependent methyltransferase [Daldinia caldariorum]|uniref:S-adenosyl-L-methionine-dependent methyltransferase n=1 Tax=Daldinia caldariorum TaxID=326644 RepID=UPI002007BCE4|nr:S-adenosyl-L-methionine-dependent methyltransferase [Daldinia caldariorum]KAI1465033.1 S-adenosyl-L-methionine-dependent methyltransferase [Daldinia caldariorum]
MEVTEKENPLFWTLRNIEPTYWDEYIATRPVYDEKIFQRIYDYHASHSQPRLAALDIGTGSGSAIWPLTKQFGHVVASDNDPISLTFAQRKYLTLPSGRLSYTLSSGEDLLQHHLPGSFDLVTCAETFPLMDTQTALDNISTLLRPGGTLAVWFYGPPFFTEAGFAPRCQEILDSIMDHNFRPIVSGGGEARRKSWKRAADGKFSWLDYIPFASDTWSDIRRHKWNTHARLSFFTRRACDFPVEPVCNVGPEEAVSTEQDLAFWEVSWDVEMLRKFVRASFPKPNELTEPDNTMDGLFEQLARAMGEHNAQRKLSWPAVLILAEKSG